MTVDPELRWPKLLTSGKKSRNFGSQTRPCRRSCRSHGWSRHSRTLWGKKLRRGLTSVTQETTKQIAIVKSGLNSLLIFTKTNFLFVSCVTEPNAGAASFPIRSLNVIPSNISKYANLGDAFWARTFFLLGIDMWKSQFQHLGWRSPFAACCKIYVVYVRLSFTTCINKC